MASVYATLASSALQRLRNAALTSHIDMDLCCLIDSKERLAATDLVTMLGDLLERGMFGSPPCQSFLIFAYQKPNST